MEEQNQESRVNDQAGREPGRDTNDLSLYPLCLPEIPEGPLPADLFTLMGETGARKLVQVHGRGQPIDRMRRILYRSKRVLFFWTTESEIKNFPVLPLRLICETLFATISESKDASEQRLAIETSFPILRRSFAARLKSPALWSAIDQRWKNHPLPVKSRAMASLAALFAFSFGQEDAELLSDMLVAGLLHDQPGVATELHTSARVSLWISQQDERFAGGGPLKLEGFQIDDMSQLLGLAKQAVGKIPPMTLAEAFRSIAASDPDPSFPKLFNPDLFRPLHQKVGKI